MWVSRHHSRGRRPGDRCRASGPTRRTGVSSDVRHLVLLAVMVATLVVVGGRLVWAQWVAAPAFAERAEDQRVRDISLAPRRGIVYDREGEPLAVSTEARTVFATPHLVTDPAGTAAAVARVLGGDAREIEASLRKDAGFVYVARKVDVERARALERLDLAGIGFVEDSRRVYPLKEVGCQVLGFVGVDDSGLTGLEKHYDELLAGKPGRLLAERDPRGRIIPGGVMSAVDPVDGVDIVLTIDKDIQQEAEAALAEAVEEWDAERGSIVAMDPRSGEILAMASTPAFDPNDLSTADDGAVRNRVACDTYEPGSTIKTFTAAATIDKGFATPKTTFRLPPTIRVGGRTIKEAHPRPAVTWTLTEILSESSNVGAVKLGMALGSTGLYQYFKDFGLLERTGIDFPGEACGWMPAPADWSASTIGNVPFGQGVSVTTLQLARALAAIANGGELVTPHLLMAVPDRQDVEPTWPRRRAIGEGAARSTTAMLRSAVSEGTGKNASVPGYAVAGKTGTAQRPLPGGRGYKGGGYIASFSGYFPAEDPRLLMVVSIEDPKNAIFGGTVAAPVFGRVGRFAAAHLHLPPSVEETTPTAGTSEDAQ